MVFFNHATRQMTAKIVYYGPGLCGKTTNLNTIYGKTSQKARGEMVSLNTETDRTLFFDLLPMDVGMVGGFKTKLQLYTVPGQVFYNSTRKLVLKGVDGIVFVVDSQRPMLDACKESYLNLQENLRELGLNLGDIPMVYQWNKRDLRSVVPVEELEAAFNPKGFPSFQSVASDGTGVFETLRGITKLSLSHIKTHVLGETNAPAPTLARPVAPPAPPPASAAPPLVKPPPAHPGVEALTLSDLPSITDLLDMEGSSSPVRSAGAVPLPDEDDDSGFFIEAPVLPEPPEVDDDIAFLTDDEDTPPPAVAGGRDHRLVPLASHPGQSLPLEPVPPPPAVVPLAAETATPKVSASTTPTPRPMPAIALPAMLAAEPPPAVSQPTIPVRQPLPVIPKPPMPVPQPLPLVQALAIPLPEPSILVTRSPIPASQPAQPAAKVDPLAALASLKLDAMRPAVKPKPLDHKDAINSIMGELTQVGRSGVPSVLRLELPPEPDGQEIEVVVQLRRQGQVLVEGQIRRPSPGKGITARLSVEMKRS